MKKLTIYDPAMCCPTGVCGTDVDTKLVQLASFLSALDKNTFEVNRYGLTTEPAQYVSNVQVSSILKTEGVDSLPLVFLNDELIFSKEYPSVPTLSAKLGLASFSLFSK
ncbi:MAG: arsenite efflux transporter metallochaperone ArsD [Campylobacteraceae bacterium]|nr:arsenite efflux transporter metallochaperone ArsD [Campylobacteraceae bacterium]